MPINFTCPHCGQLLSVAKRKIGTAVQCVRCNGGVVVPGPIPAASSSPEPHAKESVQTVDPLSSKSSRSTIQISRLRLYIIAGIIVTTGIMGFLLGWGLGRQSRQPVNLADPGSWQRVSGHVTFVTRRGDSAPDSESVVIVLPANRKPDEKLQHETFRPDVAPSNVSQTMMHAVRSLGGGLDRVNHNGNYEIELPMADEYFVLIISGHQSRKAGTRPTTTEIAELSKYFDGASDLVSKNAFLWRKQIIKGNVTLDHVFDS